MGRDKGTHFQYQKWSTEPDFITDHTDTENSKRWLQCYANIFDNLQIMEKKPVKAQHVK